MIKCKKCDIDKDKDSFNHNRRICKECLKKNGRDYRRSNDKSKQWANNNKERMKELQSSWYIKNKIKIREHQNELYHTNSDYKKIKNYKTAVSHMINDKQKTNQYIGCDSNDLKYWCEFCFTDNMLHCNYSNVWVIDHVVPINNKDLDFNILSKWYNIMPVKKTYNLIKNKYIDKKQIKMHILNLELYYELENIDQNYIRYLQNCLLREPP